MIKRNIIFIIGICIVSAACGYSDSSDDTSNQNELAVNEQEEIDSEKEEENTTQVEVADTAYDTAEISYEETTDVSEEKVTDNNDSTAEVASESEENLLKQMPDLDRNVKEMVPTIESYIETIGINGDTKFTVANTELFWGFVLSYCNKNGHYTSINVSN